MQSNDCMAWLELTLFANHTRHSGSPYLEVIRPQTCVRDISSYNKMSLRLEIIGGYDMDGPAMYEREEKTTGKGFVVGIISNGFSFTKNHKSIVTADRPSMHLTYRMTTECHIV